MAESKEFYDKVYAGGEYCSLSVPQEHGKWGEVEAFVSRHDLRGKRCLEIGCGRGFFQDLVADYTGLDVSTSVRQYLHKPFVLGSARALPFASSEFDAIWTVNVLEHVPSPEAALEEMRRVLKPDGLLLLSPAWQCRPWAAQGYPVRPYSALDWRGKLVKASIPLRDSMVFRSLYVLPHRLGRLAHWRIRPYPLGFKYRTLEPNFDHFWMSDSDAVNSMDPYEAILWFVSRGDECLSHQDWFRQLTVRTGGLIFRISKQRV